MVKGALERLHSVSRVVFLAKGDRFVVQSRGEPLPFNEVREAVLKQVVFSRGRYLLSLLPGVITYLKGRLPFNKETAW